jgi:hypothetical protein
MGKPKLGMIGPTINNTGTISFDFDDTLSHIEIQEIAYKLKSFGFKIVVCTARYDDDKKRLNTDLFEVVHRLGLTEDDVIFCGGKPKNLFLDKIDDLLYHLDDNFYEAKYITKSDSKALGLHILQEDWINFIPDNFDLSDAQKYAQVLMHGIISDIKQKQKILNCVL